MQIDKEAKGKLLFVVELQQFNGLIVVLVERFIIISPNLCYVIFILLIQ